MSSWLSLFDTSGQASRRPIPKRTPNAASRRSQRLVPRAEQVEARVLLSEFRINTYTTAAQSANSIAMDANGDFVVTWTSFGQEEGFDIFAQRYNAAGIAQGAEFRVNDYTTGPQRDSAVAMDAAGNFVIVWNSNNQSGPGSGWDVYAKRYDAAGATIDGEFPVNTYTNGNQFASAVAMDADGDFVVAWDSDNQDGSGLGVYARRFDGVGVPNRSISG
ncbi:hypothetical protein V5E97_23890 [Singulisphaera sp. Ch08]|uniref:Uncharacterized protein n=1 Tax=Singulisphaera sp. Ch08 TaxID=3120278 RepID=A0AAU7C8N7_9BACT